MTEKQKLQKQRSWFKFQLLGIKWLIEDKYLTETEKSALKNIKDNIENLKFFFETNSSTLGLNVPEHRCWCGKPAKIQVDYYNKGNLVWVCNKHKEL